jgi:hypothetical protein
MLMDVHRLKLNYKLGKQGHMAKSTIYNDYLELCEERGAKPIISPTFFGKVHLGHHLPSLSFCCLRFLAFAFVLSHRLLSSLFFASQLVKRAFPGIQSVRKGPRGQVRQCYARLKKRKNQLVAAPHGGAGAYDGLSPAGAHHQTSTTPPLDLTVGQQQQLHAAAYQQYYQQQFGGLHAAQYGLAGHHYAAYPGLAGQQHRTEVDRPAQQQQHYVDHHHLLQQHQQPPQLEVVQHHLLALRGRVKEEQQNQHQYSGGGSGRGSGEADDERNYGSPGQHHHQAGSRGSSAVADGYGRGDAAAADAASTHGSSPLLSSSLSSSSPAYNLLPPLQSSSLHQHSPLLYSAFHSPADAASHYGLRHHQQPANSSSADDLSGSTSAQRTAYASALGSFSHFPTTTSSISAHPPTPNYNNLDSSSSPNLLTSPTLPPPSPLFPPLSSSSSSSSSSQIYMPAHHQQHHQHQQSPTYPYYYRTSTEQHYTHTSSPPGSSPSSSQHLQSQAPPPAILHPPLTHPGGAHYAMRLTPLPPYPSSYTSLHSGAGGSDRASAGADDTEGARRGS